MASRQVPDFPAVLVALEHVKELEKELKDEAVGFAPEASVHLSEITSAITDLEAERRAAHEHLEVATIENSKLRHEMNSTRDQMSAVIVADVAAARAANAEEIELLRKDLLAVFDIQEATVKKHEEVLSENELRSIEREKFKAEHQEAIAALNNERTQMYALQSHLDQTRQNIQELKASIASMELDSATLQEDLAFHTEGFVNSKDNLSNDLAEIEKRIKCQEQEIMRSREQLEVLSESGRDGKDSLDGLHIQIIHVKNSIQKLKELKSQCEKNLEAERGNCKEFMAQKEELKKQVDELIKAHKETKTRHEEEITAINEKMVGVRAVTSRIQDALNTVYEVFKVQDDKETEVKTEYDYVSGLLEKSKMQLEERIGSIVRLKKGAEEMEKQMKSIKESDVINKRVFESEREELCGKMDVEKQQTEDFEEEKRQLLKLLQDSKTTQEEYVKTMTTNIKATRRRVKELQTEESALKQEQPMTPEEIKSYMKKSQAEYEQIERLCLEEIQQFTNDIESITKAYDEKQTEVAEKQEILKRVEAKWKAETKRHEHLKKQEMEFKMKKHELKESIEALKKETVLLLKPKEELKVQLERAWAGHMDQLSKQATERKSVEMCIYDSSVKLEQVQVENSRLHLCIRQMTEDMNKARENKERCTEETDQLKQDSKILFRSLQKAWRDEFVLSQERHCVDAALLVPMEALQNHQKTRGRQLGHVQTILHEQMLDFSRRLGDRITVEPQT